MTGWESPAIAVAGWLLNISALATVLNKEAAVPRLHSATVLLCMIIYFAGYHSLGLLNAAISVAVAALIWLFIFLNRHPKGDKNE